MYLPVTWVDEYVNEKFYWDDVEKMLVYTLPDSIVYADKRTLGSNGQPLVVEKEGKIYLSVGLVSNYTNIRTELYNGNYYDSVVYSRIYVDTDWSPWQQGTASKNTAVRVGREIPSGLRSRVPTGPGYGQKVDIWVIFRINGSARWRRSRRPAYLSSRSTPRSHWGKKSAWYGIR